MSSISETGQAKNITHFEDLIHFCQQFGTTYNPPTPGIGLAALNTKLADARNAAQAVIDAKTGYNIATNSREILYNELRPLATRIINVLEVCGASEQTLKDARSLINKMYGRRVKSKPAAADRPLAPGSEPVELSATRSVSQQGFDALYQHFAALISLLAGEPAYIPNETDLGLPALNSFLSGMLAASTSVSTAVVALSNARLQRNTIIRDSTNGLMALATHVKKYVKAMFGARSPQYRQVSGLVFF